MQAKRRAAPILKIIMASYLSQSEKAIRRFLWVYILFITFLAGAVTGSGLGKIALNVLFNLVHAP